MIVDPRGGAGGPGGRRAGEPARPAGDGRRPARARAGRPVPRPVARPVLGPGRREAPPASEPLLMETDKPHAADEPGPRAGRQGADEVAGRRGDALHPLGRRARGALLPGSDPEERINVAGIAGGPGGSLEGFRAALRSMLRTRPAARRADRRPSRAPSSSGSERRSLTAGRAEPRSRLR